MDVTSMSCHTVESVRLPFNLEQPSYSNVYASAQFINKIERIKQIKSSVLKLTYTSNCA